MVKYKTLQDVVDVFARRFNDGRGRATNFTNCLYVTHDGNHCVVGALLTSYSEKLKFYSCGVITLFDKLPELRSEFSDEALNIKFMSNVQHIHDTSNNWSKDGNLNKHGWQQFSDLCSEHPEITLEPQEYYCVKL